MSDILNILDTFKGTCACGKIHTTTIRDIQIGSGLVHSTGAILKKNGFRGKLLIIADQNTWKASHGIQESLTEFETEYQVFDNVRVATMEHVKDIEELIGGRDISILSVGTDSINDICRLAAARQNKKLCIFATAPSMDGFASYSSPIVKDGFKSSYPAKSPEVIIGDTRILAAAPQELKSAGFGDMIAKYVALMDWKISALLTGEHYCERVASLTQNAIDELFAMAEGVTTNDEYTAGKIFEALLKTGIGMSYMQNSRPASGSEHIIAHLMECIELQEGIVPNYHGDDVGVCTLEMLKFYNKVAEQKAIETKFEQVNWNEVFDFYGKLAEEIKKLNFPDNIIDEVEPEKLRQLWPDIVEIIHSYPTYEECKIAMEKAHCKTTLCDIQKSDTFFQKCVKYSPYMRRRLTLLRLKDMMN